MNVIDRIHSNVNRGTDVTQAYLKMYVRVNTKCMLWNYDFLLHQMKFSC